MDEAAEEVVPAVQAVEADSGAIRRSERHLPRGRTHRSERPHLQGDRIPHATIRPDVRLRLLAGKIRLGTIPRAMILPATILPDARSRLRADRIRHAMIRPDARSHLRDDRTHRAMILHGTIRHATIPLAGKARPGTILRADRIPRAMTLQVGRIRLGLAAV